MAPQLSKPAMQLAAPAFAAPSRGLRGTAGATPARHAPVQVLSDDASGTSPGLAATILGSAALLMASRQQARLTRPLRSGTVRHFFGSPAAEPAPPAFSPAAQTGAIAPLGYFDPLEICKEGDEAKFLQMRAYEIKNGRVAMMASLGLLVDHFANGGGHGSLGVVATDSGVLGTLVILMGSAFFEATFKETAGQPGNFGDPLGFDMDSEEMRNKELSNGRMAMISVLGIFTAELATGKDAFEQFGLGALPKVAGGSQHKTSCLTGRSSSTFHGRSHTVRHFFGSPAAEPAPPAFSPAAQTGAIAPLGYFDPLEICKEGDEAKFLQMRAYEIKNGRVAMMASLGLLVDHFANGGGHGSLGVVATDSGVLGTLVILMGSAFFEATFRETAGQPGNFGDPLGFDMDSEEMRNKELSNGRMAMISVLGIFTAELATGKDAFEQFGF